MCEGWIDILASVACNAAMCITNVFQSTSNAALSNFFLLLNSSCLVVGRALAAVYNFQVSSCSENNTSVLLKIKKDMPNTIFIVVSANKKDSWNNQGLPSQSFTKKLAKTILKVLMVEPSIFWALTLVCQV